MISGRQLEEGEILSEINITPLTDIFLVLLVIFMVTSSAMSQLGVEVDLPETTTSLAKNQDDGVVLTIRPGGGLAVNGRPILAQDWLGLEAVIHQAFKNTPSRLVILEGDQGALLGSAIQAMEVAKKAGATQFAIATTDPSKKGKQK